MAQAQDMIRKKEDLAQLRRLLLDGVSSSPTATVDAAYFNSLRESVRSRRRRERSSMADPKIVAKRLATRKHPWAAKDPSGAPQASAAALRQAMTLEGLPPTDFDDLLWIMA